MNMFLEVGESTEQQRDLKRTIGIFENQGFDYLQDDQEFSVPERIRMPSGRIFNLREIYKELSGKLEFGNKNQIESLFALEYYALIYELDLDDRSSFYDSYLDNIDERKTKQRYSKPS